MTAGITSPAFLRRTRCRQCGCPSARFSFAICAAWARATVVPARSTGSSSGDGGVNTPVRPTCTEIPSSFVSARSAEKFIRPSPNAAPWEVLPASRWNLSESSFHDRANRSRRRTRDANPSSSCTAAHISSAPRTVQVFFHGRETPWRRHERVKSRSAFRPPPAAGFRKSPGRRGRFPVCARATIGAVEQLERGRRQDSADWRRFSSPASFALAVDARELGQRPCKLRRAPSMTSGSGRAFCLLQCARQ